MVKNLSLLVSSLIFILFFSEALCRLLPKCRYDFIQFVRKDEESMSTALNRKVVYPTYKACYSTYRASDILGYERIPLSAPGINSYGLVGKEYPLRKKKDTFRILIIGDSITEDNYYVEELERRLNSASLKYNFELWNAGVGGYNLSQYAKYLKYKGIKFNPDMVIIGFSPNDFDLVTAIFYKTKEGFIECYNPTTKIARKININPFLFKHSYLYRFLIINLNNLYPKQQKSNPGYHLEEIKNICEGRQILLLSVIFPLLKSLEEYSEQEKSDYKNMLSVLENLKIDYIDLHNCFLKNDVFILRENEKDYFHPSKLGHKIAAEAIYKYLLENYL